MTHPLVTIVTPSYNQREYLEETIVSVLEQDYPAIEYFVIDDGSTDGSPEIIERYADRITWWTAQPNAGQVATINRGFARANGKYIGWINSDDTLLPGAVSRVVQALEENPDATLAYGGVYHTDAGSERGDYHAPWKPDVEDMLRRWTHLIAQQGSLYRRDAVERVGPLDESRFYVFDAELFVKLALAGRLLAVDAPIATYRFHESSHSLTQPVRRGYDHIRLADDLFAWDGLPEHLRRFEAEGKAHAYLWAARLFYTGGEHGLARRWFLRALRLQPALAASRAELLLRSLLPGGVRRAAA